MKYGIIFLLLSSIRLVICSDIISPVVPGQSLYSISTEIADGINLLGYTVNNINTLVPQLITSADIGTAGYTITTPGVYALASNIIFNPATPAPGTVAAAITIASSNVTLLLGNYRISQPGAGSPNQTPYVIGILIPDTIPTNTSTSAIGLESIYISGDQAIIDGFSMYGMRVFGHTYDIQISDLTIKNCGLLASKAVRSQNSALINYFPQGIPGTAGATPLGIAGLCIGESDIFGMGPVFFTQNSNVAQNSVSAVVLQNVSCLSNFFMGLCIANSSDVTINNCHFDDTFCDDPTLYVAGAAFGPANTNSENPSLQRLVVTNSTFNNSALNGDYTTSAPGYINNFIPGALLCRSSNISFDHCHFDNTNATFPGNSVTGFLAIAILNATMSNCSFDGTQGLSSAVGFHLSGYNFNSTNALSSDNVTLRNCTANNIQQMGNLQIPLTLYTNKVFPAAVGYELFFAKNMYLENCLAEDIISNGPVGENSVATGFLLASGSDSGSDQFEEDNAVLKGCIASRVTTSQGGHAVGFFGNNFFGGLRTISLDNCIANGNQALVPTIVLSGVSQGAALGFWFSQSSDSSTAFPVSYTNCKALYNQGAPSVANPGSLGVIYSAGFFVSSVAPYSVFKHSYYSCEALSNVYGFLFRGVDTCTVRNCRADNNVSSTAAGTGEGFTDLGGATATPAAVGISNSYFEGNSAYNNGLGTSSYGQNQNYNVIVNNVVDVGLVSLPILAVSVFQSTMTPLNPSTYYAGIHNISTITGTR
jgi:hypothetical protein